MRAKPRKERVNDSVAVLRDFFCAFSAFPASSPSVPNKSARIRDFFSVLAAIPQCFYGFQWGYLAQFSGWQPGRNQHRQNEVRIVTANTSG